LIGSFGDMDPASFFGLVYDAIAAAVAAGAVLGLVAVWLSTATRGTDAS